MRLSTSMIFDSGAQAITRQQSELFTTQQQIATGRRILEPADDPVAAAETLRVEQALNTNVQHAGNLTRAKDTLALTESLLGHVDNLLIDARTLAVNAGNGALLDIDRASIATELQEKLGHLIALANTGDGNGGYLFSGFQLTTQPFTATTNGVVYNGDQGQRAIEVSAGRQIAVSESGSTVFERIRAGNGVFVVAAAPANTGTGVMETTSVTDPNQLTGHDYRIDFSVTVSPPVTTYSVVDTTTSTTLSTNNPYTAGGAISFDGVEFTLSGAPANGDQFTVTPSNSQSVFTTLANLMAVLRAPVTGPDARARLTNGINDGLRNLDQALNNVLSVRASLGARMSEVDALTSSNADQALQYQQNLSELQDVDYNKAVSDLSRQQLALQAAQQSFARISQLSLFNEL